MFMKKMTRIEPHQTLSLDIYPLSSSVSRQAIDEFSQLLSSSAGPHGKNHIIRNACGGHMTVTSTCLRLLTSLSVSRSELKLFVSAFTNHLQQYFDCGLFMAHTSLTLTRSSLDLDIPQHVLSSAYQSFLSIIVDYIQSENCDVCVKADLSNINVLLAYVRSILTSKSLLNLQSQTLKSLSIIVLNAFVKAIPSTSCQRCSDGVFIIGKESFPIKKSKVVDGVILEFLDFQVRSYPTIDLTVKKVPRGNELNPSSEMIKIALVTCSMSGDIEDIVSGTYEGTEQQFMDLENFVLDKVKALCDNFEDVGIVLCQRVIHPTVKSYLKLKGIVFVDRIGSQSIPYLKDLTGCQPIVSINQTTETINNCLGCLTDITLFIENGKNYICLQNCDANVVTLLLCAEWEERVSELKHCVKTCIQGLGSLVKEPRLLMGGGCWQMHCSFFLKKKVLSKLTELTEKLSCTESTVRQLLALFRSCLKKWCLNLKNSDEHLVFDPFSLHSWRVTKNDPVFLSEDRRKLCCCGLRSMSNKSLQNLDFELTQGEPYFTNGRENGVDTDVETVENYNYAVLDGLEASVEAFQKGVITAGLLLSIGQLVFDRN